MGATAIDLFLLKRGITGKSNPAPQSLKDLGGIPKAETVINTAQKANTTQAVTQSQTNKASEISLKPIWKATPSETVPSSKTGIEPLGIPEKIPTKITNAKIAEQARGIKRQNESAEVMAKNGYQVEYNPKIEGFERYKFPWLNSKKRPDFKIEGEIFDAYSPNKNTSINNIVLEIRDKTIEGQSRRILLNLDDSRVSVVDLAKELRLSKLQFLDEVIAVKDGKIIKLYPYSQAK